jgi:glutamine synthetase
MGATLTNLSEAIADGQSGEQSAEQQLIGLGVAKLPEIEKDNTDRNRTSPFAFTGAKFEFRAVGSSASVAFPVMLLNACVAGAIDDLTGELRRELAEGKDVDDAVLAVVRAAFQESAAVRFEGNGYSQEWVEEAQGRGLHNLRRTPEALEQIMAEQSKELLVGLGILNEAELESRFHVRMERYVKDMFIEAITLTEMVDTQVLPAAFSYLGSLNRAAAHAKQAGITSIPQIDVANRVGALAEQHDHHPALLTEWGRVTVSWWTHTAGGVTSADVAMARRTSELAERA